MEMRERDNTYVLLVDLRFELLASPESFHRLVIWARGSPKSFIISTRSVGRPISCVLDLSVDGLCNFWDASRQNRHVQLCRKF